MRTSETTARRLDATAGEDAGKLAAAAMRDGMALLDMVRWWRDVGDHDTADAIAAAMQALMAARRDYTGEAE